MLKFQSLLVNQALKSAIAGFVGGPNSVMILVGGAMPSFETDSLTYADFTPLTGDAMEPKPCVDGALHHHDADFDAFHLTPIEWVGDNVVTDQAATGYIIVNSADIEPTSPVIYAEEFGDPKFLVNSLDAFTVAPIFKLPRRGDHLTSMIID